MPRFQYQSRIPADPGSVFRYHARPGAFERLIPPWERIEILDRNGAIENGSVLSFRIRKGPFSIRWTATHVDVIEGKRFCDVQSTGPFKRWEHVHRFLPGENGGCLLTDEIVFETPMRIGHRLLRKQLERMFRFRHQKTYNDLIRHTRNDAKRDILIVGGITSFIKDMAAFLGTGGHRVYRLDSTGDRRGFTAKPFFEGCGISMLEDLHTVLLTGVPYADNPTEQALSSYLQTVIGTLRNPPVLLLRLSLNAPNLDRYTDNPGLDIKNPREPLRPPRLTPPRFIFQREVVLNFGSLIQAPYRRMIELLLHLETFLFLKESARTPHFFWIAKEDAIGAVLHAISDDSLHGPFAVAAPEPATRAALQELLLRRGFTAYTLSRMLKVLPWASPGLSPDMEPGLSSLPNLSGTGFKPLFSSLESAIEDALG